MPDNKNKMIHNLKVRKKISSPRKLPRTRPRPRPRPLPPQKNNGPSPGIRYCQNGVCSCHLWKISAACTKRTFKAILSLIPTFSIRCTGHNFQQFLSQTAKFHRAWSRPPLVLSSSQRHYTLKRLIWPQQPRLVNSYSTRVICKKATILLRTWHSEWRKRWVSCNCRWVATINF